MPGILGTIIPNDNGLSTPSDNRITSSATAPVLIVGGGPTGLLSAYMLSKLGGELNCG